MGIKNYKEKKILKYWSKWRLYTTHEADLFKCRCQEFTYPYLIFPLLEVISLTQSLERKRFWTKIIRITQKSRLGEVTMDVLHLSLISSSVSIQYNSLKAHLINCLRLRVSYESKLQSLFRCDRNSRFSIVCPYVIIS